MDVSYIYVTCMQQILHVKENRGNRKYFCSKIYIVDLIFSIKLFSIAEIKAEAERELTNFFFDCSLKLSTPLEVQMGEDSRKNARVLACTVHRK